MRREGEAEKIEKSLPLKRLLLRRPSRNRCAVEDGLASQRIAVTVARPKEFVALDL